jgi:hypothetical protein
MKPSLTARRVALATLVTCFFVIFARIGTAQTVPTMTIEIHNDSERYSIYPVLSTGGHFPIDTWMQAAFNVPKSHLADNPYPTPNTFRLYFNPTGAGIPPHSSITVTLPLYTQLVPSGQVNPKLPDQYVDWWNGGRISIYASPFADGAPPKALVANYTARPSQKLLTPVAGRCRRNCSRVIVLSGLGIGANLRTVHGEIDTLQKPNIHTLLDDSLEQFEKERRLLKTAVPILGECRVMWNLLIEAEASEPAISKVHPDILDETTLTGDSVQISDQKNAEQYLWIN